jgi:DNA-binding response OmpR family regulator
LQAEGADMAVLDINMPEMDGIELLGNIRSDDRFKNMPVIMLTIRAFTEDQVQGYECGADDYLTKPFSNDVLIARVKVLERRILGK